MAAKQRVVVAMSGGVDSSVAAQLLIQDGYEVIGISMKTHESPEPEACASEGEALPVARSAAKNCCSVDDIMDARSVAQRLGIPFYAMNFKDAFKSEVMDYFAAEYGRGRTPNPCVKCNDKLKFKALLQQARALGAEYLATGHYVRKFCDEQGRWHIQQARDRSKDQSYFLFGLGQDVLRHILFPLGDLTKPEVRELARGMGLVTADKPESQEICFVPNNDYAAVLTKLYPDQIKAPGVFKDKQGRVLGTHQGAHAYTVGQRRGLGIAAGERIYVTEIDAERNEVILGEDEDLFATTLSAREAHWIVSAPAPGTAVQAKIRYRQEPSPAFIEAVDETNVHIRFAAPQRAITPGQAIVFYQGEELLGGAWIES